MRERGEEIHGFLGKCRSMGDQDQFGVKDCWMPPEEFESECREDCDDFALWVWRQRMAMGKEDARSVAGLFPMHGVGHAWVTYREENRAFLLDPLAQRTKEHLY